MNKTYWSVVNPDGTEVEMIFLTKKDAVEWATTNAIVEYSVIKKSMF